MGELGGAVKTIRLQRVGTGGVEFYNKTKGGLVGAPGTVGSTFVKKHVWISSESAGRDLNWWIDGRLDDNVTVASEPLDGSIGSKSPNASYKADEAGLTL